MTGFKKGDRIVLVEDDYYFGVEMPKGTRATYDDGNPAESAPWVRLDTGERVLTLRDRIAHAEPETVPPFEATTKEPHLIEWATEVDTLGTKEIWDSEAEAREMADRYGQRLFRVEWTEVPR